tara:strand:- start:19681 stop:19920 length:240 start_codon:yes stop_codon:yes gene_type:complete
MGKAVLTWNLSDRDENQDFKRIIKSADMAMALFEISTNMIKKCKQQIDSDHADDVYNLVSEHIESILQDYHIDIDDLVD